MAIIMSKAGEKGSPEVEESENEAKKEESSDKDFEEKSSEEPKLEEDDEEDEEEEDENQYERDGFVVGDDEVEDEEIEEIEEIKPIKVKKIKKKRKRLRKVENEDSAEDDLSLIAENLNRQMAEDPTKHSKTSEDSEENSDHELSQGINYSEFHSLAKIFAYEAQPSTTVVDSQPEFEPAEKKERFRTVEYERIKEIDIPERLQNRLKYRENPSEQEIIEETEWLFTRCLLDKNEASSDNLRIKIARFLTMYRVEKYEIPFIHLYRMHLLGPELKKELL